MIIDFKNYWDDGRGPDLVRYAVLTCAAAFLEWLLQLRIIFFLGYRPGANIPVTQLFGYAWFVGMILLAIFWLVVVIIAFRKCGWPAIVLLISLPWGIRLFASWDALEGACFLPRLPLIQGCP